MGVAKKKKPGTEKVLVGTRLLPAVGEARRGEEKGATNSVAFNYCEIRAKTSLPPITSTRVAAWRTVYNWASTSSQTGWRMTVQHTSVI